MDDQIASPKIKKIKNAAYEKELARLQIELVKLQEWVRGSGEKIAIIFEGRDAAGKGGTIKRMTEPLNPRIARIVALPAPTEREQTQWYFQRYAEHLPAAGEIVIFDRSQYHTVVASRFESYNTALQSASNLKQKGVDCYVKKQSF